jgi:hypothetical protein
MANCARETRHQLIKSLMAGLFSGKIVSQNMDIVRTCCHYGRDPQS